MNTTDPRDDAPEEEPSDSWRPDWHSRYETLGGTAPPPLNSHLSQLKPYTGTRPAALDRAIELARERAKNRRWRPSGHSLIR